MITNKLSSVKELIRQYQDYLAGKEAGGVRYLSVLKYLTEYTERADIKDIASMNTERLLEFQLYLYDEYDFTFETVRTMFYTLKRFFAYLMENNLIKENLLYKVEIIPKPQPKKIISRYYSFDELISRYLNYRKSHLSYGYLIQVEKHLKGYFRYLRNKGIKSVYSVTEGSLLKYRDFLWQEYECGEKDSLVPESQIERLGTVCRFFRYLYKEGLLRDNPALNLAWKDYFRRLRQRPKKSKEIKAVSSPLDELKQKFIDYEKTKGKSLSTLSSYKKGLEVFFGYMQSKGLSSMAQIGKRHLMEYYPYLYNYRGIRNQPVGMQSKAKYLWVLRLFFKFLIRFDYLPYDASFDLEPIKEERPLPKDYLNQKEVFYLLNQPGLSDSLSIRDKAILEVLFSTGMRNNELCQLNIADIDFQQEMVRVSHPKGGSSRQRIVPVGQRSLNYVNSYLAKARPELANGDPQALFLSYSGKRIKTEAVLNIVKKYAFRCGFRKNITPHSLRVTCATLMLKYKAGLRYVQEQLGHRSIRSTQIYTRLIPLDLKLVHQRCHPGERIDR